MKKTKIMAAYLPQFHEIPENNLFWGEGFTDWVGVKNAVPQFEGHIQPKVPVDKNYYDLSDYKVIQWQAHLAKEHGINGFNIYHYWFKEGKQVLQKPAELLLEHPEIDIEFFFSWDNCSWVRSWSSLSGNAWAPTADGKKEEKSSYLLELDYGDEKQWEEHFFYLLPFFKDSRYVKINDKPVFAFFNNTNIDVLLKMEQCWKRLAKENGLKGLYLISRHDEFVNKRLFDTQFLYQPPYSSWGKRMSLEGKLKKYLGVTLQKNGPVKYMYEYDHVWKKLLKNARFNKNNNIILGAFVNFDDTPRRGREARIIINGTADKFEKYFNKLYKLCCENNKEILLITAWNEWGEGAYLEPDSINHCAYLEAIKRVVEGN